MRRRIERGKKCKKVTEKNGKRKRRVKVQEVKRKERLKGRPKE